MKAGTLESYSKQYPYVAQVLAAVPKVGKYTYPIVFFSNVTIGLKSKL
ncbi:hypothetical protein [Filimonas lacunae]|nr:hypothetical protein [Filimonas lacunae]